MKAIVTVGVSASGKTTWAEQQTEFININRDDIRFNHILNGVRDWSKYKFNKTNEHKVSEIQTAMINDAAIAGTNIIISDTNLNPKIRNQMISRLEELNYEVEIKEFPISFEDACKRDALRANGVGHSVIARQIEQWNEYQWSKGEYQHTHSTKLPDAIIVDIDGTVADMKGIRGPFEWDKVGQDKVVHHVAEIVRMMKEAGYKIILMSGRDSVCKRETEVWLENNFIPFDLLLMRSQGDMRKDTEVKKELFDASVKGIYNVITAIDDRPSIVRLWQSMGIKTMAVGNQLIEF